MSLLLAGWSGKPYTPRFESPPLRPAPRRSRYAKFLSEMRGCACGCGAVFRARQETHRYASKVCADRAYGRRER